MAQSASSPESSPRDLSDSPTHEEAAPSLPLFAERETAPCPITVQVTKVQLLSATDVIFTVASRTDLSSYAHSSMQVQRRIRDFQWLHDQLERTHAASLIPPLPPPLSSVRSLSNTTRHRLLNTTQRALQRFLCRVVSHPLLHQSEWLQIFLETSSPSEFKDAQRRARREPVAPVPNPKPVSLDDESDSWFVQKYRYFSDLHSTLHQLVGCARRLTQHHQEADRLHQPFARSLQSISTLQHDGYGLSESFDEMSEVIQQLGECESELSRNSTFEFLDVLSDYAQLCGSALTLFRRRAALRIMVQKNSEAGETQNMFETYSEQLQEEITYFEAAKTEEISNAITQFVQIYLRRALLMKDQWQKLLKTVEQHEVHEGSD